MAAFCVLKKGVYKMDLSYCFCCKNKYNNNSNHDQFQLFVFYIVLKEYTDVNNIEYLKNLIYTVTTLYII